MPGSTPQHPYSDAASAARKLTGRTVVRIDRVFYEANGVIERGDGPLEIYLDDGSVLLLDGASDGESLRVRGTPWADPFEGEISPESEEFIAESGKWTRVSVSKEALYSEMIGARVKAVEILENEFGRSAGMSIETDARTLWFVIEGDEAHVYWASPIGFRPGSQYTT